jgi:2'-5' RNA ligase
LGEEAGTLRLFFALWPSDAQRKALVAATAAAVAQVECHPVPPGNLHVTLAFLGQVPARSVADLLVAGGQGDYPALDLAFDRLEYWPKPRVLVALASQEPAAGPRLVDRLWRRIEPLGIRRESRPWQAHLTLARKVRRPPAAGLAMSAMPAQAAAKAAPWRLALVESVTHTQGARYRLLADWPF